MSVLIDASYVTNVISKLTNGEKMTVVRNTFTNKAIETVEIIKNKTILAISKNSFGLKENPVNSEVVEINFNISESRNKVKSIDRATNKVTINRVTNHRVIVVSLLFNVIVLYLLYKLFSVFINRIN